MNDRLEFLHCRFILELTIGNHWFSSWFRAIFVAKPIAPCRRDFFRVLSRLQVITGSSNWFIALFSPFVIGRSNHFGIGFFDCHLETALSLRQIVVKLFWSCAQFTRMSFKVQIWRLLCRGFISEVFWENFWSNPHVPNSLNRNFRHVATLLGR